MNYFNVIHLTSDKIHYLEPDTLKKFSNLRLVSSTKDLVQLNVLTLAAFSSNLVKYLNFEGKISIFLSL